MPPTSPTNTMSLPKASTIFVPNPILAPHSCRPHFDHSPFLSLPPPTTFALPFPVSPSNSSAKSSFISLSAFADSCLVARVPPCVATNIPLKTPSWTAAFLDHSHPAGIAIDINAAYDRNSHSHQSSLLALKEASRATSLTISHVPGHHTTCINESVALLNARPAPLLHEFYL
ncbi:hypothetical protein OF83DRAFT_1177201 [Amylostereum chailletii]|nr:hypothetical protein OF83DRAFT_1177201 [Amylostereum chailletii]